MLDKTFFALGGTASLISMAGLLSSFGLWEIELLWGAALCISLIVTIKSYGRIIGK